MGQREYIEKLISKSDASKRRSDVIQAAYEKYDASGLEKDFEVLIKELDAYCISWVRKKLWKTGCYSDENEHSVMQESRIAVWKWMKKERKEPACHQKFAYYAFGIYKKKTLDEIRKFFAGRPGTDPISLQEAKDGSEQTCEEKMGSMEFDDGVARDRQRQVYERLFLLYCRSFLESADFPPGLLALYYARVLPNLLEKIPNSKMTSVKWAYEYMEDRTIGWLKADSEGYLYAEVDKTLKWGEEFCRQLQEKIELDQKAEVDKKREADKKPMVLKDVVYTEIYNKRKIEYWADCMHKAVAKTFVYRISEEAELLELAEEYMTHDEMFYKLFGKGDAR